MARTLHTFICTALLLCCIPADAAGPKPVTTIDLRPFGYKASSKEARNDTHIKFWKQYVVIDSVFVVCGKCGPGSTSTRTPGPRLVIDTTTGKQVPAETVANAVLEPNPQDLPENDHRAPSSAEILLARWRGMTLTRDSQDKLWLQEPGREKTLLFFHRGYYESATFVGPDRILIIGQIDDNPGSRIAHMHEWVVDKSGNLKYKLPACCAGTGYYALNRAGDRFAVRDAVDSAGDIALGILALGTGAYSEFNKGRVRVFNSENGQKLFEYKWGLDKYEHDPKGRIALSEDGSLLALLDGHKLLIFQIPNK